MDRVKYPRTWHLPDSPNRGADAFGPEREGVVVRWAGAFAGHQVGKLVRKDHVKTDRHWMHGEVSANGLAAGA